MIGGVPYRVWANRILAGSPFYTPWFLWGQFLRFTATWYEAFILARSIGAYRFRGGLVCRDCLIP